jgi:hypothetical protein
MAALRATVIAVASFRLFGVLGDTFLRGYSTELYRRSRSCDIAGSGRWARRVLLERSAASALLQAGMPPDSCGDGACELRVRVRDKSGNTCPWFRKKVVLK